MNDFDWSQVRAFLAVARAGSLTGAAEALGSSQPTVGRQLRALEEAVGAALIVRHARGVVLTDKGRDLLEIAVEVAERMDAFARVARGVREVLSGTVRIAATEIVGTHVLTSLLAGIRRDFPHIELELVLDNSASDLTRGEADIAVRLFQPSEPELIGRRLGALPLGFYASAAYLARRGAPDSFDELLEHDLIGFDSRGPFAKLNASYDSRMTARAFALRTDSLVAQLEAGRHGAGIVPLQREIAARYPELQRVLPALPVPPLPLWLLMHKDIRGGAHIRAVFSALADGLSDYVARIES
ncbi:MAG: LysR family transcriptional regulator [Myxococcota bacterium]